jgi:hypothetical protein
MHLIPVPELVVALVISLIVLGRRRLRGLRRLATAPRAESLGKARKEDTESRKRAQLIASCVVLVIIGVPLILRVVPPNGFYGFRTPATQSSSAIWYLANAFMGWTLVVAAVVSAVLLMILPATVKRWVVWASFLVPVFAAILTSFVYLNRLR